MVSTPHVAAVRRKWAGAPLVVAWFLAAGPLAGQGPAHEDPAFDSALMRPSEALSAPAHLVVERVSLEVAMEELHAVSGIAISFSPNIFPANHLVTCLCEDLPLDEAVRQLLVGTGLELAPVAGQLVIRRIGGAGSPAAVEPQRQASLQGIVVDESSGQPLGGASVVLDVDGEVLRSTATDRNGFYQIGAIVPGGYVLRIQYLGYHPHQESIVLAAGEQRSISIGLTRDPLLLEGVVVDAPGGGVVRRDLGRQLVTPGDMRRIPQPAASGDMASYLQTLPGVVVQGDRGGQLFIRGSTPAENMTLIDGNLIYQPFHIVGFFSAFPEDLVADADFYLGGFGARYTGRTASVLDVQMRDGHRSSYETSGAVSPFLAEVVAEGPIETGRMSWIASIRQSLIDHSGPTFAGERLPLSFESQYLKVTSFDDEGSRCSVMGMRTADEGRMDAEDPDSMVSWSNLVVGARCIMLAERRLFRLFEVNFGYSTVRNAAITRGVSEFRSSISRMSHDVHTTSLFGAMPIYAGYHVSVETPDFDFMELFAIDSQFNSIIGISGYVEGDIASARRLTLRPGLVLSISPRPGIEPRIRSSWRPFGRSTEEVTAVVGLYNQDLVGISDTRDAGSVFVAWMRAREGGPLQSIHGALGWQQELAGGFGWSIEGYYKRLRNVPIAEWRGVAQFHTSLGRAHGEVYGVDGRLEYDAGRLYGYVGYGFGWTRYETAQEHFEIWFGDLVQRYHPPHDRRHSANALVSLDFSGFTAGVRWQYGDGRPFTQPLGIDEAFDIRFDLEDVRERRGTTRVVLDRPYQGRLPAVHRLDLSLERSFRVGSGSFDAQIGAINMYDRQNMFYYDIFTGRRVDQLPLVPYMSLKLKPW